MPAASHNKQRRFKPKTKEALHRAIEKEMQRSGNACDLNFIDVSEITDFEDLFLRSPFNGDISKWNVSKATTMHGMFQESVFNGDISRWDVSNVTSMKQMFGLGQFNGDISKWNVNNVREFKQIFYNGQFDGDISTWPIHQEAGIHTMFSMVQMTISEKPSIYHWRLAQVNLNNVSPILQAHYKKHEQLIKSIVSDPVERAYWIHDQWCQEQARNHAPPEIYAVGQDVFESESGP